MAGKGGGSWKVAYADFVTAMMAFFLVMWIGAQDSKTRQSVANYFIDPTGVSKKPSRSGAVMPNSQYGNQPEQDGSRMERGRETYPAGEPQGPATVLIAKWLSADEKRLDAWRKKARAALDLATKSPEVRNRSVTAREQAIKNVGNLLRAEFLDGSPTKASDAYQDLMLEALREVKWDALAEDLLK